MTVNVGGYNIQSKLAIQYLGVMIDSRMTFREHAVKVSTKGAVVANALTRLLKNIGGEQGTRRRLLSTVKTPSCYMPPRFGPAREIQLRGIMQVYRVSALHTVQYLMMQFA